MTKTLLLCAAFLLALSSPAYAKQYHGTYEQMKDEAAPTDANPVDPGTGLDKSTSDPVKYNSDGTERSDLQKEDQERRIRNGERTSGPHGDEDMFPHNGKLH